MVLETLNTDSASFQLKAAHAPYQTQSVSSFREEEKENAIHILSQ